ncbi:MAG: YHS domain-containing protein, partial [Anaerohalosphaera sp.]|nr:YHS domain-containing protein [Anaerohalosphaera sp.]
KGKKVYFCCPGCDAEFKKDPEKYIGKLPQFKE